MKILMHINYLNPAGGVEQYIVSLLPELQRQEIEVVFCLEIPSDLDNQYYRRLKSQGIKVHYPHIGPFPVRNWSWPVDFLLWLVFPATIVALLLDSFLRGRSWRESYDGLRGRLNNLVSRWLPRWVSRVPVWTLLTVLWLQHRPQLLHVLRVDSVAALQWGLKLKVPLIYTEALEPGGEIHYPQLSDCYREFEPLAPKIPMIVTQSKRVQRSIRENWHADANVRILPWVVSMPNCETNPHDQKRSNLLTFGYAGRLSTEKNVETFLEAARLLLTEYGDRIRFVVAGGGPAAADLMAYAEELGVADNVLFSGPYTLKSLPEIFASMDVFVISSLTEGAPLAVIEAMAYGKPVVATDVAGTGELVVDTVTGFLVSPKDPVSLAEACARFIMNPDLIDAMGQAANSRYQLMYTPQAGVMGLQALYTELVSASL